MRAIVIGLVAFGLFLSSGCSRLHPEKPTAAVQGVSVGRASLSGISGTMSIEVSNPNDFGVPLSAVDWELSVGGARAVSGTITLSDTIPAKGTTTVDVSLTVGALDAVRVARKLSSGERGYRISGVMHFKTSLGRIDVAFSGEGDLGEALASRRGQGY